MVKVAIIGAGSFVFGPSVLNDAIVEQRLDGVELALVDVDGEAVEWMAGVGRRMARESGVNAAVTAHTQRATALQGAQFVICAAAREIHKRFEMDCEIIQRRAPGHLVTEFGGVAGISYSLRQIALILEITADMKKHCPKAWLLNAANPLPRLVQAAHEDGIQTVGFCSASLAGYRILWQIFKGESIRYPFQSALEAWSATMAGLNHFSWLLELRERKTNADLLPELRQRLAGGAGFSEPLTEDTYKKTGWLPMPGDAHIQDFLPPRPSSKSVRSATHGSGAERRERLRLLSDIVHERQPWTPLLKYRSWERPMDLVAAMAYGRPAEFPSLNLINSGQIPALPSHVFVETPASASRLGPVPKPVLLPKEIAPLCQDTARVTDLIVRAALQRKKDLLRRVVDADPTITDKLSGLTAVEECMKAHADILPRYE